MPKWYSWTILIIDCTFTKCRLIYTGGDIGWHNTKFIDCQLVFNAHADRTITILKHFGLLPAEYSKTGPAKIPQSSSDIYHVNMKDAMRLQGAFKAWKGKPGRRDELLIECAKLAQAEAGMLFVSVMDKGDFLSLAASQKNRLKNPVFGGFEICVRALA